MIGEGAPELKARLESWSGSVVWNTPERKEGASETGGSFHHPVCQAKPRRRLRDRRTPRAGRAHRSPERIGRLRTRRMQRRQEGITKPIGRIGSWSGSVTLETGACLKGRRAHKAEKRALPIFGEHLLDWIKPQSY